MSAPSLASGYRATAFAGDFDMLPLRAGIVYGPVPLYPTDSDFHIAASIVTRDDDAAAHWQIEAIRERRVRPGALLDDATLRTIAIRVAKRLFDLRDTPTCQPEASDV